MVGGVAADQPVLADAPDVSRLGDRRTVSDGGHRVGRGETPEHGGQVAGGTAGLCDHGVQLRTFPDDVWARVKDVAADVAASSVAGDELAQRIYESYMAARERAITWSSIADGPYLNIRGSA